MVFTHALLRESPKKEHSRVSRSTSKATALTPLLCHSNLNRTSFEPRSLDAMNSRKMPFEPSFSNLEKFFIKSRIFTFAASHGFNVFSTKLPAAYPRFPIPHYQFPNFPIYQSTNLPIQILLVFPFHQHLACGFFEN